MRAGHFLIDRTHILFEPSGHRSGDALDRLLDAIAAPQAQQENFIATQIGYRAISDVQPRVGTRSNAMHAFCEPVLGVAQFVRSFRFHASDHLRAALLWRAHTDLSNGTFLIRGQSDE